MHQQRKREEHNDFSFFHSNFARKLTSLGNFVEIMETIMDSSDK